jgi:predicted heme/steroid binding protein
VAAPVAVAVTSAPGTYTLAEIAKHNSKTDCWCVINGQVLDVTKFLKDHPGGELAILTFAGKDASAEFNMIHPAGVVEKYAPDAVIGKVATGAPTTVAAACPPSVGPAALNQPLLTLGTGNATANEHWWGEARNTASEFGAFGPSVSSFMSALWYCIVLFLVEVCSTIFVVKNYSVPHDKSGLTRSAIFLIMFIVIHGVGNLHVFFGPDHFNGYTYFLNHPVPWGALALPVEVYLLLAAILHVVVATIRTVKFKKLSMLTDASQRGQVSMAITGFVLLIFLVVHLMQFRFATNVDQYYFRAKWMYPFFCDRYQTDCEIVHYRDLYKLEFELFQSGLWVLMYEACVLMFLLHATEGWTKVVNASTLIPRTQKAKARLLGQAICVFVSMCYFSFPIFCYLFPVRNWTDYQNEHVDSWLPLVNGATPAHAGRP